MKMKSDEILDELYLVNGDSLADYSYDPWSQIFRLLFLDESTGVTTEIFIPLKDSYEGTVTEEHTSST